MRMTKFLPQLMSMTVLLYVVGEGQITWGGDVPCPDADVYQRAEQFHGDSCTGQLIGVRLGLAAKGALQNIGVVGKLKARFFDQTCAIDGIQVAAGTTMGTNTLEIIDRNENRLELSDINGMHVVEVQLTKLAQEKSKVSLGLKKKMRLLPAESDQMKQLKIEQKSIFSWFRNASDAEVVIVRPLN